MRFAFAQNLSQAASVAAGGLCVLSGGTMDGKCGSDAQERLQRQERCDL